MILIDTSVWIDFFNRGDDKIAGLIEAEEALLHPMVIGEIGMGSFASAEQRDGVVAALGNMPVAAAVSDDEFHDFVSRERLYGTGLGYVDARFSPAPGGPERRYGLVMGVSRARRRG